MINGYDNKIPMYQVEVMTKSGSRVRVGPMWSDPSPPQDLAESINRNVVAGTEKDWRDATVIIIQPILPTLN